MDNSAKQSTNDQAVTQSKPVASPAQNAVKQMQQSPASPMGGSTVINRGGIKVEVPANNEKVQVSAAPVSAPAHKESEPAPPPLPDVAKMTEVEAKEEEIEVEKELESWIEKLPQAEKPKISEEAKQAGLTHAKEDTPMPPSPTGNIVLPMSYEEAKLVRRKNRWRNSISWFATLVMYHWKRLRFNESKSFTENKKDL